MTLNKERQAQWSLSMSRNRKQRPTSRGESSFGKLLAVLIGLAVILAIGSIFYINMSKVKIEIDPNTLCQVDQKPTDIIAILIDATEGLPERAARQASIRIKQALSSAPENSLINLYSIKSGNESHIEPIAHICKPSSGENVSNLTGNKNYSIKQYKERFLKPLKFQIDDLIDAKSSSTSPLIESMQSAIIESFEANANTGEKRLIIVSDMIQNTNLYSFYREKPSYKNYNDISAQSGKGILRLDGIKVEILVVARSFPKGTRKDVVDFWSHFLTDKGAATGSAMEPLL